MPVFCHRLLRKNSIHAVFCALCLTVALCYPLSAADFTDMTVPHTSGTPFYTLRLYDAGVSLIVDNEKIGSERSLSQEELSALYLGSSYISSILRDGLSGSIPIIAILPRNPQDDDAAALSPELKGKNVTALGGVWLFGNQEDSPVAWITVNRASLQGDGWETGILPVLPQNAMKADLPGTIAHEIFHAMGSGTNTSYEDPSENDEDQEVQKSQEPIVFRSGSGNRWIRGLRDLFGTAAQLDMPIIGLESGDIPANSPDPDTFFMFASETEKGRHGGAFFTAEHVNTVLNGAKLAWPDDATTPAVSGLPINGFERNNPDLSHIELQNSLMSHQSFRNWSTFMEAELAVLQDLGYQIDRRRFFGNSIYGSGSEGLLALTDNTSPFYARNATGDGWLEGKPNPQDWGIGLHVYGSWNDIRQSANLLSSGQWGMGIRMDGVGNQLTVAPGVKVHADGAGGNALLVAYGRGHQIVQRGDLQALGKDGVAARFDFGSNELGDYAEYRGSFIYACIDGETWQNSTIERLSALNGPLVERFDVTGRLAGESAAIFISPNALVSHIDIMRGATLQGDIRSDWNPEKPLYEGIVVQAPDGTDLTTELAFGRLPDTDGRSTAQPDSTFLLSYDGTIAGASSLRLNVVGGRLEYNGNADILSANVMENAALTGIGTFRIDQGKGTFTNSGFIAPDVEGMQISGDYTQTETGTLMTMFDTTGTRSQLQVDGNAALGGKLAFSLIPDAYAGTLRLQPLTVTGNTSGEFAAADILLQSPTLRMSVASARARTGAGIGTDVLLTTTRAPNAYSRYADAGSAAEAGRALSRVSNINGDMRTLFVALDFSSMDGSVVRKGLSQLTPDAYSNAALATFDMHRMLSDLMLPGSRFSAKEDNAPDSDWHIFVQPYAGTVNQSHGNGLSGYDASNVGLIGGAERRTAGGLTVGGHVVFNHQSMTGDNNGKLHGEGLYLGAQGRYAPVNWNGLNLFALGRVGMENWRMKREVSFDGYNRQNSKDWTGYSGTLRFGSGYEIDFDSYTIEPFVALDYAFSSRPSLTENDGMSSRLHLDADVYHSLRSSLGARVTTDKRSLNEHATWQAHLSAAWNHELLDKAGTTRVSFAEASSLGFSNKVKVPGRDSLGLGAGLNFATDKNVTFSLNAGSELFRREGTSVYGNLSVGWTF